jgi:hypothetical protein
VPAPALLRSRDRWVAQAWDAESNWATSRPILGWGDVPHRATAPRKIGRRWPCCHSCIRGATAASAEPLGGGLAVLWLDFRTAVHLRSRHRHTTKRRNDDEHD